MAKQDDFTRYTIRVPSDLYERVSAAADASGRSVNGEIIATLEEAYPAPSATGILDIVREFMEKFDKASSVPEAQRVVDHTNAELALFPVFVGARFGLKEGEWPPKAEWVHSEAWRKKAMQAEAELRQLVGQPLSPEETD
jgi:hypothetical protein